METKIERLKVAIQKDVESMISQVSDERAWQASADQMERHLFKFLLMLGAQLLTLFFAARSQRSQRSHYQNASGEALSYQGERQRLYGSIFGIVPLIRPYFYRSGRGGVAPLDSELSLGEEKHSDLVREISELLSVTSVYHKSSEMLRQLFGLALSTGRIANHIAEDAVDVEAYYAQKAPPPPEQEASILVIQGDGKGVPMIQPEPVKPKVRLGKGEKRGQKQEAIVTSVYTIAAAPRTPEQVLESLFALTPANPASTPRPATDPCNKHLWATLDGKDAALDRLAQQVAPRQGTHIQHQVALCDGCQALQLRIARYFPDFTLILDFLHANEYLWDVATALFGETNPKRLAWMQTYTLHILTSHTPTVLTDLRQLRLDSATTASQRRQLEKTIAYFERNLPFMDYALYLANGWPIASGVIEGACRHFVKDRCELSGMRWSRPGVEALLRLRAIAENRDWDAYHAFRKQQRHLRLYGALPPVALPLEFQSLDSNFSVSFSLN